MKKLYAISVMILFAVLCVPVSATEISAWGYGETEEASKKAATQELVKQIVSKVSFVEYAESKDDSSGSAYQSISSISMNIGDYSLHGRKYRNTSNEGGRGWKSEAYISEDNLELYKQKAEEEALSIKTFYDSIDGAGTSGYWLSLIGLIDNYEFYRSVAVMLASPGNVSIPSPVITRKAAEAKYQSTLNISISSAENNIASIELQLKTAKLTNETKKMLEAQLAQRQQELDNLKKQQEEMKLRNQEEIEAMRLNLQRALNMESLELQYSANSIDLSQINQKINTIVVNNKSYSESRKNLQEVLNELYDDKNAAITQGREAILGKEYLSVELDENGNPKAFALESRKKEADAEEKRINTEYESACREVFRDYIKVWTEMTNDAYEEMVSLVSTPSYKVYSSSSTYFDSANFNLEKRIWKGYSIITIGNGSLIIPIQLPFEAWTKVHPDFFSIKAESNVTEYQKMVTIAQNWQQIFEEFPAVLNVSFDVSIREDKVKDTFTINADKYTITSNLNGKTVYEGSLDNQSFTISAREIEGYSVSTSDWVMVATKPSKLDNYDLYKSVSNKGVPDSKSGLTININNLTSFSFYVQSNSERFDYVIVYELDSLNPANRKKWTRNITEDDYTDINKYREVRFDNIDGNAHSIRVEYIKNSQTDGNDDCGYILIPKSKKEIVSILDGTYSITFKGGTLNAICFNSNGGTQIPEPIIAFSTDNYAIPQIKTLTPEKSGFYFTGWFDNPECLGQPKKLNDVNSDVSAGKAYTVYAGWSTKKPKQQNVSSVSSETDTKTGNQADVSVVPVPVAIVESKGQVYETEADRMKTMAETAVANKSSESKEESVVKKQILLGLGGGIITPVDLGIGYFGNISVGYEIIPKGYLSGKAGGGLFQCTVPVYDIPFSGQYYFGDLLLSYMHYFIPAGLMDFGLYADVGVRCQLIFVDQDLYRLEIQPAFGGGVSMGIAECKIQITAGVLAAPTYQNKYAIGVELGVGYAF